MDVRQPSGHASAWPRLAAGILCACAAPVGADDPPAEREAAQEIVYAAPTRPDKVGRIMAPVLVNGRGPFAFIIDIGASRSALAPRLATELGLAPDPTRLLSLRGVTGAERVASIQVDQLDAGDIQLRKQRLPVVSRDVFADADGILGVDGFARMCLAADFAHNRISITRNGCPMSRPPWLKVPGRLRADRLFVVNARIGRTPGQAVVDTGAESTMGNPALLRALELELRAADPDNAAVIVGATSQSATGSSITAPTMYLGEIGIGKMRVTFGDFEVFRLWKLEATPALVLGMDVLGTVDQLMIDYRRAEFRVLLKSSGRPALTRQTGGGSRIQ